MRLINQETQCLPESSFVVGCEDVAVVEEAQEEEGAAFLPLGHALNLFHVAFTALDVGASLNRMHYFIKLSFIFLQFEMLNNY